MEIYNLLIINLSEAGASIGQQFYFPQFEPINILKFDEIIGNSISSLFNTTDRQKQVLFCKHKLMVT